MKITTIMMINGGILMLCVRGGSAGVVKVGSANIGE